MQEGGWNIDYFSPNELEVSLILLTEETIFLCLVVNVIFIIVWLSSTLNSFYIKASLPSMNLYNALKNVYCMRVCRKGVLYAHKYRSPSHEAEATGNCEQPDMDSET